MPRVAITTDWLTSFGGAERVLGELRALYPSAPIFTSVYDPRQLPEPMRQWDVRSSFLGGFPFARSYSRALLPLMPMAFQRFDFSNYDVVVSVSSAFSKNVVTAPGAKNLCYCLTPPRYLWDLRDAYLGRPAAAAAAPVVRWLRGVDRGAARRVDEFLAISHLVADRVRRSYAREADVVYPPVDTARLRPRDGREKIDDYYLVVSRLVRYKRIDLAIEACNRLGRRLLVVGVGPERRRLELLAGPTVRLLGARSDDEVAVLYRRCRAFVFPALEDFGITAVEAQAAGRPVVAFGGGGGGETVLDGVTGIHFSEQTVESVVAAMQRLDRTPIDPAACRKNAERFDASVFRERIEARVRAIAC